MMMDENTNQDNVFYANGTRIGISTVDLFIEFAHRISPDDIFNKTTVFMSPHSAKKLLLSLTTAIEDYEKEFGVINLPPRKISKNELKKRAELEIAATKRE